LYVNNLPGVVTVGRAYGNRTRDLFFSCCEFAAVPPKCPVDVVIVLDVSGSIGIPDFDLTKSFLEQLVGYLDIDSGNTRVGLVTYSSNVGSSFDLNMYSSVASVQSAILSLSYSGGTTNTAGALTFVRTTMLTSAAGDRSDVPNVVVLLTDGGSDDRTATEVGDQLSI